MNKQQNSTPVRRSDPSATLAWLQNMARQARLAWRLLLDQRVSAWTKLIPPVVVAYILFPLDILPDVTPLLGQLDDVAVLFLGMKLFIEMSPPDVVREHLIALGAHVDGWRVVDGENESPPTVIEGEYELANPEAPDAEESRQQSNSGEGAA